MGRGYAFVSLGASTGGRGVPIIFFPSFQISSVANGLFQVFFGEGCLFFVSRVGSILAFCVGHANLASFVGVVVVAIGLCVPNRGRVGFFALYRYESKVSAVAIVEEVQVGDYPFMFPICRVFTYVVSPRFRSTFRVGKDMLGGRVVSTFVPT